ncbi:MAG: DUF938 domain-containing protein [Pseudomonadota bacterium]
MQNFSQAAANNSEPILAVLKRLLPEPATLLEVGSGAGQHAICFTDAMPGLSWQPTEQGDRFAGLCENVSEYGNSRVLEPLRLDLADDWPTVPADHVYAANVLHIVSEKLGQALITGAGRCLSSGGMLLLYGPFCYAGRYTSNSNADFDHWLRSRDPESGIRDVEWVQAIATRAGFLLLEDCDMPANNRLLVFRHR